MQLTSVKDQVWDDSETKIYHIIRELVVAHARSPIWAKVRNPTWDGPGHMMIRIKMQVEEQLVER